MKLVKKYANQIFKPKIQFETYFFSPREKKRFILNFFTLCRNEWLKCYLTQYFFTAPRIPRGSSSTDFRGPHQWRFSAQHLAKFVSAFLTFFLRPFTFCIFEVVLLAIIVLKEALLSTSFCGLRKIILCVIARPKSYRSSRHSSEKKALCLVKILAKCFKIFHTHMLTKIFIVFQKHGFCRVLLLS